MHNIKYKENFLLFVKKNLQEKTVTGSQVCNCTQIRLSETSMKFKVI